MRLTISGDGILERLGLGLGVVPTPLVATTFGPGYGHAVVAGTRLGLFEALADGPQPLQRLAEAMECSVVGVEALADCLVGADLLRRRDDTFSLTRPARTWLLADAPRSLRDAVLFMGYCHRWLAGLEDAVRTGVVVRVHDREHPPEFWRAYTGALASFARLAAPEIVRRARLPAPRRLLDVGGNHGLYAAAWCARHPELQATVLDLPEACAAGRPVVANAPGGDRVTYVEGDFRAAPWGEGWDVVLLFIVLHNATEPEARLALARARESLAPGGRLVICDAAHSGTGKLDFAAGWNELFFFLISGAQAWPEETLTGWAREAGFTRFRRTRLLTAPNMLLVAE
jgi:SAM-dependent methyltransferase